MTKRNPRRTDEEWINLIQECRSSGLSDKCWCEEHHIHISKIETAARWYNYCALEYLSPIYESLHQELLAREVIHADEVPCQVLHEQGREATSRSYMWTHICMKG